MNRKKRFDAPRELVKWIERLDLNYQVTNYQRDLSNGIVASDILKKYMPDINMNYFYNEQNLEKKFHNWNEIQRLLKKKEFNLSSESIKKIVFMEEKEAFNFLV